MILNSFQEPLAEIKDVTGIVLPGLRLNGSRQQSRQGHCDRFSVFKRKHQRYGIAALVEKFQLYRLAVVKSSARRQLAAANYHGFGGCQSVCAGIDFAIWNPRATSEVSKQLHAAIVGKTRLEPDPDPEHETSAAGHRYMCTDITHPCGKMQSPIRLRYTEARPFRAIACSIG